MLRYAITNRAGFAGEEAARRDSLLRQVAMLAAEGVEFVQLREKDLAGGALAELVREVLATVRAAGGRTKVLVNSRADVALAAGADGVHLTSGPGELTPAQVRWLYAQVGMEAPVVSVSCHTVEEVTRATEAGVGLVLFGPVFEKRVAGGAIPGSGLDLLAAACRAAGAVPVLALGGVTRESVAECLAAGAAGIAGIRLFQ
jgi:thiamine-phosphate pyrophosphorylase